MSYWEDGKYEFGFNRGLITIKDLETEQKRSLTISQVEKLLVNFYTELQSYAPKTANRLCENIEEE